MDVEREGGMRIKLNGVGLKYDGKDGNTYRLDLIERGGDVDLSYEV